MKSRNLRPHTLIVRLAAAALLTLTASSALAYSFERQGKNWVITCNDTKKQIPVAGSTPVGEEGDTGDDTVHGIAASGCKNNGG